MAKLGEQSVGSIVKLNVNGTARNFIVVHQGLPSSAYDSSCNGTWLLMENLFTTSTTDEEYASSKVHSYLTKTFIPMLDEGIQNAVYTAKIPYCVVKDEDSFTVKTGSNGLSVKAFILSHTEIGGSASSTALAEGACLSYFSGKGNSGRIAYPLDSSNYAHWWTRSPINAYGSAVWEVYANPSNSYTAPGTITQSADGNPNRYIRPALILDPNLSVDGSGNVVVPFFNGYANIGGVNKELTGGYVNIGGVWKEISGAYMCVNGGTPATLPSGYTQVEYIQSSGTQYIDTGFVSNQNTKIDIVTMPLSVVNPANGDGFVPYGSAEAYNKNAFEAYSWDGQFQFNYGTQNNFVGTATANEKLTIIHDKNSVTVTSQSGTQWALDFNAETFTVPYNMTLFATQRSSLLYGKQRIYSCKIYDNGTLVRDFIPCQNSAGTAGLYDTVNGVFYTNAGSGTFAVGQTVGADGGIWRQMA